MSTAARRVKGNKGETSKAAAKGEIILFIQLFDSWERTFSAPLPTQNFYEDLNVKIPELFPHNKRIKRLRTTAEYLVSQILKGTQITLYCTTMQYGRIIMNFMRLSSVFILAEQMADSSK